jgi:hypothetical protein
VPVSLLQSNKANPGAVTSSTLAFSSNTTAGSLLMVHVLKAVANSTLSASDNVNGTYNQDVVQNSTSQSVTSGIFTFPNCAGGATTVTFGGTGAGQLRVIIEEWSGIVAITPLDQTGTVINLSAQSNWSCTASGATTQANELVVCHAGSGGASNTFTANQIGGNAANQDSVADNTGRPSVEYLEVFSTGTFTCTWTNTSQSGGLCVATYKVAAPALILMGAMCL